MIDIKVNGQSLDLLPNTSIRIEASNPMFDLEGIPGALSYPFTIPDTDRNRSLLQYAKVLLRKGGEVSLFDCTLYLGGLPFLAGKLYLQKTSNLNYSCYLSANTGDFASKAQNLRLSDLPMGGPRSMGTTEADFINAMNATTTAGVYPAQDFVFFPIYNDQFGMSDPDIELLLPGFPTVDYTVISKIQNYWYANTFWPEWFNYNSPFPYSFNIVWALAFPFASFILKQIAEVAGYVAIGSYFKDIELNSLVLNSLQIRPYGSYYQPSGDHSIDLAVGMPEVSLGKFLIGFKNTFCLAIFFNAVAKTMEIVPIKQLLQSQTVEEWTQLAAKAYTIEERTPPIFKFEFSLDSNDEISSSEVKDLTPFTIESSVPTIATLPLTDPEKTIRFVKAEFAYFQFSKPAYGAVTTPSWELCSVPFQAKAEDAQTKTISSPFSPIAAWHDVDPFPLETTWLPSTPPYPTRILKLPHLRQNGSFNIKGIFSAKDQPRLMFYRGLMLDNNGDLYPMGSSDNYDMDGNRIGEYSLAWDGDDGLYNVWWKDWVYFMQNTRRVTRRVTLGIHELINLDMKTRKRIDGVNYFIEKISVTIGMNGIQPADVTFLKG